MMPIVLSETPESNEVVSDETLHFNYPGSDIILRSCDSHNFRMPKLYIAICSPVLRMLFRSVPNTSDVPNSEQPEPLPVVELPESKATLYNLLTFIFPVAPILPSTTEKVMELLGVAQKYQMESVLSHIRGAISRQDPPFIRPETALHVYFLAQEHELHQEVVQAARVTFRLSMTIEDLGDKLDFPGIYIHELWKYHKQVRTDLKSVLPEFRTSGLPDDMKNLLCGTEGTATCSCCRIQVFPLWLGGYIDSIAEAPHLVDPIEFENAWARHIQANLSEKCPCVGISSQAKRAFGDALTAVVRGVIEKAVSTLALVKEDPASENPDPPSAPLFLDIPDADIILRSSDQVNFSMHKSVLALSSPFFKDLLSLPQPCDEEVVDGIQVVQLPEDAGLLYSLVSFLYPVLPVMPQAGSYERVYALLAAGQKYDMVSIQYYIRAEINRGTFPSPVEAEAFSAYAIASSMHLVPEMENAARLTLGQPMTFESLGEGLRLFKGRALCDLVRFRATNNSSS